MPTAIIDPSNGQIGATSLYISPALRGQEFARQAVETTRSVGRHYGRFVVAEAPVRESDEAVERYEKFGDGRPRVCLPSLLFVEIKLILIGCSFRLQIGMRVWAGDG